MQSSQADAKDNGNAKIHGDFYYNHSREEESFYTEICHPIQI